MDRRGFLRRAGAVASAAVIIPGVAAASLRTESEPQPVVAPEPEPAESRMTDAEWRDEIDRTRDEMLMARLRQSGFYQAMILERARQKMGLQFPAPNVITPTAFNLEFCRRISPTITPG